MPAEVVPESVGREAVERIAVGIRDTQERVGMPVPDGGVEWARRVVEDTIKRHEAGANRRAPAPEPEPGESPSRITRGDVGPGAVAIDGRDLAASPRGRRHLRGDTRTMEITLLDGRLELLEFFPCQPGCMEPGHRHPWQEKLFLAADDAIAMSRRSGYTDDDPRCHGMIAAALLTVVELSGQSPQMGGLGLGDYRHPKREPHVRLPRRRGLVPLSQLPRPVQSLATTGPMGETQVPPAPMPSRRHGGT
mgnify:CR=1 FL=1